MIPLAIHTAQFFSAVFVIMIATGSTHFCRIAFAFNMIKAETVPAFSWTFE
jgi:hypothetical protein